MLDRLISDAPHSASVRLSLETETACFFLSQVGPYSVTFKHRTEIPAGDAAVVMFVDGSEHRWPVRLERDVLASGGDECPVTFLDARAQRAQQKH